MEKAPHRQSNQPGRTGPADDIIPDGQPESTEPQGRSADAGEASVTAGVPASAAEQGREAEPELSIVIPAYNEADLIEQTIAAVGDFVAQRSLDAEVIVVDDGSEDETAELAERALRQAGLEGRVLRQRPNAGKGKAVHTGMLAARGRLVLMTDADLSTPLAEYDKLAKAIAQGADIAIASRALPGAKLEPPQPWWRQSIGKLYGWLRRRILLPGIIDSQCGFKLFTREAAQATFPLQTVFGWAFDAEILHLAQLLGFSIAELPVKWHNRRESKVRVLRDAPRVLKDLLTIRRRHMLLERQARARKRENLRK